MSTTHANVLHEAYQLIKAGQKKAAYQLLRDVLERDENNADAWWLFAHASPDLLQVEQALWQVLRLKPGDPPATALLNRVRAARNRALAGAADAASNASLSAAETSPFPPATRLLLSVSDKPGAAQPVASRTVSTARLVLRGVLLGAIVSVAVVGAVLIRDAGQPDPGAIAALPTFVRMELSTAAPTFAPTTLATDAPTLPPTALATAAPTLVSELEAALPASPIAILPSTDVPDLVVSPAVPTATILAEIVRVPLEPSILSSGSVGEIAGRFFEADGKTIIYDDASVRVMNYETGEMVNDPNTPFQGEYAIEVPPGTYRLAVEVSGRSYEFFNNVGPYGADAMPVTVEAGVRLENVDFLLDPAGTISGTVLVQDSSIPLANLNVGTADAWMGACTDAEGRFILSHVPVGVPIKIFVGGDNWCGSDAPSIERQWYPNGVTEELASPVQVLSQTANEISVDFALPDTVCAEAAVC